MKKTIFFTSLNADNDTRLQSLFLESERHVGAEDSVKFSHVVIAIIAMLSIILVGVHTDVIDQPMPLRLLWIAAVAAPLLIALSQPLFRESTPSRNAQAALQLAAMLKTWNTIEEKINAYGIEEDVIRAKVLLDIHRRLHEFVTTWQGLLDEAVPSQALHNPDAPGCDYRALDSLELLMSELNAMLMKIEQRHAMERTIRFEPAIDDDLPPDAA